MFLRFLKIRAKESFNLIGFGIWIIQDVGVGAGSGSGSGIGTGTDNRFSPDSKLRRTIIFY